jgi:hypothetical protein
MRAFLSLGLVCVAFAALGCSSQIVVNADYDTSADFSKYKTYAWPEDVLPADRIPEELGATNGIMDTRIRRALDMELAAKGLTIDTSDPDLIVFYHIGVEDKVDVTDWGYSYASTGRYWGWNTRNIDTYTYKEGTLIVDLVDMKSKVLVWRGVAQEVLGELTPEEADKAVRDTVNKVMSLYPPTTQPS